MSSLYPIDKGFPFPLGASKIGKGVNFSFFSQKAKTVTLCLFTEGAIDSFLEIVLDPTIHRTNHYWHVLIKNLPEKIEYALRIDGSSLLLSDPYAKSLNGGSDWGKPEKRPPPRGKVIVEQNFDWEKDQFPRIAVEDLIIYEMHVRAFTNHASSKINHPGTFLGVIEKIPHLKDLGINAVELLPIFEFNECEYQKKNPKTKERLFNFWGYSTVNFFSPMGRFATTPEWNTAMLECKTMVKELHKHNIEVILDVVFNHTAEGGKTGPTLSFRGIDPTTYYMLDSKEDDLDYTGCGNTFNCNHPQVIKFIVDALCYWVSEMHVDGFRFDLASIFMRGQKGEILQDPPIIHAITTNPLLASTKLIAEPWDAAGLYQVGSFPGKGRFAEWNGKYRDSVRRFIKGTDHAVSDFANALCGSENLYGKELSPCHSINFVTAHDGFSLQDLVSYQQKHNVENAEGNRDGTNDNESWNCGHEGETVDPKILTLRERQRRNFHLALMLSIGTPMLLMGDEYGHSRHGNNNAWCQDNELNWFLWDKLETTTSFFSFYKQMIQFRKDHPILRRNTFLKTKDDVIWHGHAPRTPNWSAESRFIAYTLKNPSTKNHLYIAFNAHFEACSIQLPAPPASKEWRLLIDTSLPNTMPSLPANYAYQMPPYSALIAKALP